MGDVRLLRNPDRLGGRPAGRVRGALAQAGRDRLLRLHHIVEPRVQEHRELTYREVLARCLGAVSAIDGLPVPEGRGDALAESLPSLATLSRGAGRTRRAARARLASGHPVQHRPGPARRLGRGDRGALRRADHRRRGRFLQAGAGALGAVLRRHRRRPRPPRARRGESLPRRRAGRADGASRPCGSTASASRAPCRAPPSCPTWEPCPRSSISWPEPGGGKAPRSASRPAEMPGLSCR